MESSTKALTNQDRIKSDKHNMEKKSTPIECRTIYELQTLQWLIYRQTGKLLTGYQLTELLRQFRKEIASKMDDKTYYIDPFYTFREIK